MKEGMYSEQEVKEYLEYRGYHWEQFIEWMTGQTYSVIEGINYYNEYDVDRYYEGFRTVRVKD